MFLLEVLKKSWYDNEVEEQPHGDHEQGRLDEEPPEALSTWMEQCDPVRLDERPGDTAKRGRRAERGHDSRACGGSL
jgi:hypothetical protein